jgi:hypothetical protein
MCVDGRLGSRLRGYHSVALRPISCRSFVHHHLVLPIISRGTPHQATWETSVSEGQNYGWEIVSQFGLWFQIPCKSQDSFTCHKSAAWDRRLYFSSEGRHAVDFFAWKIRRLRPGSNPQAWVPEASMLSHIQRSVVSAFSHNRGRSWNVLPVDTGALLYMFW